MIQDCGNAREQYLKGFGKRLRELRQARHLRQMDMMLFDLNYKYYQRLESGQVNPTLLTLYKVATALEVSIHDLFWPEPELSRFHDGGCKGDKREKNS